jgi:hypothetical protein
VKREAERRDLGLVCPAWGGEPRDRSVDDNYPGTTTTTPLEPGQAMNTSTLANSGKNSCRRAARIVDVDHQLGVTVTSVFGRVPTMVT